MMTVVLPDLPGSPLGPSGPGVPAGPGGPEGPGTGTGTGTAAGGVVTTAGGGVTTVAFSQALRVNALNTASAMNECFMTSSLTLGKIGINRAPLIQAYGFKILQVQNA
jgi:hypothetical protein